MTFPKFLVRRVGSFSAIKKIKNAWRWLVMEKNINDTNLQGEWISHTPPFWGLICLLCGAPAFLLLAQAGQPEKGIVAAYAIAVLLAVIILCRRLTKKIWFWIFTFVAAVIHTLVVFIFKFGPIKVPMIFAASPFVFGYMAIMLFFIRTLAKSFHD